LLSLPGQRHCEAQGGQGIDQARASSSYSEVRSSSGQVRRNVFGDKPGLRDVPKRGQAGSPGLA
jgi:hypothetical protein